MTDINRKWTNLVGKCSVCDDDMRANTIFPKTNTFLCLEKEQSTSVATPLYVHTLSRVPLPNDEEHYGVRQYQKLQKTLIFPKQFCLPIQSELQNVLA